MVARKKLRLSYCAIGVLAVLATSVAAQNDHVHPLSGRRFAPVMGVQGAEWLERPEREAEEAPTKALDIIGIAAGQTIADVGAGTGYLTVRLAERVGQSGRVYANDLQAPMLQALDRRLAANHIMNVTTVLGTTDDPKLPSNAIDVALLVDVYHEFSEPQRMLRHLREALKSDGRLVLLEYRQEDPSIPIRPEHKMSVREAKLEVEAEGFTLSRVNEELPRQHILVFSRRN